MPKLMSENYLTWEIFQKVRPGLFDGFGGINYSNIQIILNEYGISNSEERKNIFDKIISLAVEMRKEKQPKE